MESKIFSTQWRSDDQHERGTRANGSARAEWLLDMLEMWRAHCAKNIADAKEPREGVYPLRKLCLPGLAGHREPPDEPELGLAQPDT